MTPSEFAAALEQLSTLLKCAGAVVVGAEVETLGNMFTQLKDKTVAAALKKLNSLEPAHQGHDPNFTQVITVLKSCDQFVSKAAATKFSKDLSALIEVLTRSGNSAGVDAFVSAALAKLNEPKVTKKKEPAAVRSDIVREYGRRLEETLGDEGFDFAYDQLTKDKSVTSGELSEIAMAFTKVKAKSRPKALQAIWNRHQSLMDIRAKAESRDGRSAA